VTGLALSGLPVAHIQTHAESLKSPSDADGDLVRISLKIWRMLTMPGGRYNVNQMVKRP
jgi:hypothetical protein